MVDFTPDFIKELTALSVKHDFLIFEDRKFADIGNTVYLQYSQGIYHISQWAHFINCHALPGPGIVQGLAKEGLSKNRGLFLISDMSARGWLGTQNYKTQSLKIAQSYPEFVVGWISQSRWDKDLPGLVLAPGISMTSSGDHLGQSYTTPQEAISKGADIIIVGRSIVEAVNPSEAAKQYCHVAWNCTLKP